MWAVNLKLAQMKFSEALNFSAEFFRGSKAIDNPKSAALRCNVLGSAVILAKRTLAYGHRRTRVISLANVTSFQNFVYRKQRYREFTIHSAI